MKKLFYFGMATDRRWVWISGTTDTFYFGKPGVTVHFVCEKYTLHKWLNLGKLRVARTKEVAWFTVAPKRILKVHKIANFFGSEFEFYTISLLVVLKY